MKPLRVLSICAVSVFCVFLLSACRKHEHTWDKGTVTLAPACNAEGITTFACTACGETRDEPIQKTGHTWDEGTVTLAPACNAEGITTFACTACRETRDEPIQRTEHSWDSGSVTAEPTCANEGVMTFSCTACNETKAEPIQKTAHVWGAGKITAVATPTAAGVRSFACQNCSSIKTEDIPSVTTTNLPRMEISLQDGNGIFQLENVEREEYIGSRISISNTGGRYDLSGVEASFKGRGNGSWEEDKKGYKIKFEDKQKLFRTAANKHWTLIACANFEDPTLYRNLMAYTLVNDVLTNIEYTTGAQLLDLYVNGEYRGVYLLCEHVRVDSGRVDIESEYGVEDTGYLIEYDKYATGIEGIDYFQISGVKYPFTVKSPDPEEYGEETTEEEYRKQVDYIREYVSRVYAAALSGDFATFEALVDIDSFVDMYILHEYFKNVDSGWSSFFMYKKPGGKLYAGPAWDFDGSTNIKDRGDSSPQGIYVADKVLQGSPYTASELFIALYKNQDWRQLVKARWNEISPGIVGFVNDKMNEDVYSQNRYALGRNFALWENIPQETAERNWENSMKVLKKWFLDRNAWLNEEWTL